MSKSTTWKDHERRLAKQTGGTRLGVTGKATADVVNDWLCIEAKCWKGSVKRVEAALEQAERAAQPGQLPIAVLHKVGRHSKNDLVILRWGAFLDYFRGDSKPQNEGLTELQERAAGGDEEAANTLRILAPDVLE